MHGDLLLLLLTIAQVDDQSLLGKLLSVSMSKAHHRHSLTVWVMEDITDLKRLLTVMIKIYDMARFYNDKELAINVTFGPDYIGSNTDRWTSILSYNILGSQIGDKISQLPHLVTISKDEIESLELKEFHCKLSDINCEGSLAMYPTVAVGGTFDHLHDGHRILLTAASFLAKSRLIVGVTGDELLKNKKYAEFLEDYEVRAQSVRDFITLIMPQQNVDIFMIQDVCGPTATIKEIDALVLSLETASGGSYVNKVRKEKGFPELEICEVAVIGGGSKDDGFKDKLSSTQIRKMEYEKCRNTSQ